MERIYTVTFPGTRDQWEDYLGALLPIAEGDIASDGEAPMCLHTFAASKKTLLEMGFSIVEIARWHSDLITWHVAKCDCEVALNAIIHETIETKA